MFALIPSVSPFWTRISSPRAVIDSASRTDAVICACVVQESAQAPGSRRPARKISSRRQDPREALSRIVQDLFLRRCRMAGTPYPLNL